jgi:hypothetical protein
VNGDVNKILNKMANYDAHNHWCENGMEKFDDGDEGVRILGHFHLIRSPTVQHFDTVPNLKGEYSMFRMKKKASPSFN